MGNRTHLPAGPVLLTGLAVMVGWSAFFFFWPRIVLTWFVGAILVFVSFGTLCSARRWIVAKRKQWSARRTIWKGQSPDGLIEYQSTVATLRGTDETMRVDRPIGKTRQTESTSDPIVKPSGRR